MTDSQSTREKAAAVVRNAGGKIVGRTRLQKVAYLLQLAGFGDDFEFEYRHYGPYSEDLAEAIRMAEVFDLVTEQERTANWGGVYSIFKASDDVAESGDVDRVAFATVAAQMDAIELELAATAAYISAVEQHPDPWAETARRKPEKAAKKRLEKARKAYQQLRGLKVPHPLPDIA